MSKNKTFGSMLIIAGTTIGAGMLALPIASAGLGFSTSIVVILATWLLMTYTALLMLEVHQHADVDATLNTLAKGLLGRRGQVIANFSMIFLFYALCAAYITGGGSQLQTNLNNWFDWQLAPQVGAIIFALLFGFIITLGTGTVDKVNRVLFITKILVLGAMFYMLTPYVQMQHLLEMPLQQGLILSAIPVVFTSFGFHGSIPSIVKYVGKDIKVLRKVMIVGASLPLVIYLFWQVISQGMMSQQSLLQSEGLPGFIASIATLLNNPAISKAVTIFADLALATSFLGVSLGLFDFFSDTLKKSNTKQDRLITAIVTFTPPLGFALFYPQGFIMALGYAAIALVVLAIFLPVAMVWQQRRKQDSLPAGYQVAGGQFALVFVALLGVLIISAQGLQMFGVIPAVG
ncbi:aromatic amino acid transport family protein [Pseudoalteromonas tunicata]|uniref:Aromatic amino acid permease n=1 Tax=Pseudoalteromonas tunicata D2 TaxID=87626 RepID=A4C4S7_9GAMM|nr:aromatic amino acid transport family protein [Pseudoalteromonas tunicata]ATC96962.1 tyrosine-specific transport protein [Pseudoalteromonas tunicata]AXT33086.1 amino acid permease [Pseudoalteromonas tunicata]EAR30559.1 tyrosine-specific transport protein (HAAAP family protein) [Pseudoalteromonas tunicata D2]MDP4983965.1 aromatic amino acid transporter [Pseudoalteromonas tunicata]MDP5213916.1 aromatic amino acid transporter [Pseudoalteromonas tunicata]